MRAFDYSTLTKTLIDEDVFSLISDINRLAGRLDKCVCDSKTLSAFRRANEIACVTASNNIEGIYPKKGQIQKMVDGVLLQPQSHNDMAAHGYLKAMRFLEECDEVDFSRDFILNIHKILCQAMDEDAGTIKTAQNYIVRTLWGRHEIIFTPVSPAEAPTALDAICRELNCRGLAPVFAQKNSGNVYDSLSLLLIPVFIRDFLCIHPFRDGNGRTSRLLTSFLLARCGYNVGIYQSLSAQILKNRQGYYEALRGSQRGWFEGKDNALPFVKYFLTCLFLAYKELNDRIDLVNKNTNSIDMVRAACNGKLGYINKEYIKAYCPTLGSTSVNNSLTQLVSNKELLRVRRGIYLLASSNE